VDEKHLMCLQSETEILSGECDLSDPSNAYLRISSKYFASKHSDSPDCCSPSTVEHSAVSEIAGGMIGFSRAGRLRVLLDRCDAKVGGGLKDWLRKARV